MSWEAKPGDFFIVGAFFDKDDEERKPPLAGIGTRRFDFPDGSYAFYDKEQQIYGLNFGDGAYIKYDKASGEFLMQAKDTVVINGKEIWLNS